MLKKIIVNIVCIYTIFTQICMLLACKPSLEVYADTYVEPQQIVGLELVESKNILNDFYSIQNEMQDAIKADKELKWQQYLMSITNNAWAVARSLVGYRGDCWYICKLFIQRFSGADISNRYAISLEEALPGDLVYYINGGLGISHWAVYLGDGMALHGNYNGSARIASLWLNSASSPIIYRVS